METKKITKSLASDVKDVNDKGVVTIQITQFDKYDQDGDRLLSGALNKTWKEGKQIHLIDHRMGLQTFVGLPIKKDPTTGILESKLNLNKQVAKDLFEDYKFGLQNGRSIQHSHGFIPVKDKWAQNEKGGFDFREVKQKEYSSVLFGAVEDTPLHAIKSNFEALEIIELLELKLKTTNISDEYAKRIEKNINDLKALIKQEPFSDTFGEPSIDTQGLENLFTNFKF